MGESFIKPTSTVERDRYERELLNARKRAEELLQEKMAAQTALQQAKAELAAAYEKSQRRALFAEQMVGIASHDLKNPLTAIKMAAPPPGLARDRQTAPERAAGGVSRRHAAAPLQGFRRRRT